MRTMDGKKTSLIDKLSKLTKIEELRSKLEKAFDVPPNMQRLIFRGKQVNYNVCHTSGSFRKHVTARVSYDSAYKTSTHANPM